MANSAGDARGSELEIRRKLIHSGAVNAIVSIGSNFFYTVTLPCTLWFFDKSKPKACKNTVLFVDARPYFNQVTRALREFTPEQLEFLANIVRLYRGVKPEFEEGSKALLKSKFAKNAYADVAGLCKAATFAEIETDEEKRGVAEGLTGRRGPPVRHPHQAEPVLSKKEEAEVKKVCSELLDSIKREKLVLDWREKQQARAAVMQTLKVEMKRLPEPYTEDIRTEKRARVCACV